MSGIVDHSAIKPGSAPLTGRKRQGLRRPSPDLINKAIDETAAQVTRIGLTFLGTAAFCLLSLFSPDSALLDGSEKINLPFAEPASFFGFMLLGPAVLVMLRVYLQIYVEHSDRLERLRQAMPAVRAPTLVALKNPLIRVFGGVTFYLVLPIAMILFAWKAAVFPAWGSGLLCVAVGVIASHAMLPFGTVSWRSKALLSVSAIIIAGSAVVGFGPLRRQFDLGHANLSNQWLPIADLSGANLDRANLSGAYLDRANLSDANLDTANLSGANLSRANLSGARLTEANLSDANLSGAGLAVANLGGASLRGANLSGADLSSANLSGADLSFASLNGAQLIGAHNLTSASLILACGDNYTRLPEGFTVELCPVGRQR